MLTATADPDADLEGALVEWRRFRRRKRLTEIHWVDALYQAYVTALVGAVLVAVIASFVGGDRLTQSQIDHLLEHGAAWLGGAGAIAIAIGLRSGTRGGPLALERPEVRHVLLSPVDRTSALRAPAVRQLRFAAFSAIVAGAVGGDLAAQRLPGALIVWVACASLFALTCGALGFGCALLANGIRLPRWLGTALGIVAIALAVLDALGSIPASPTTAIGAIALWPLQFAPAGVIAVVAAIAIVGAGLLLVGNVSLEAAERRSTLVGQLRFAATLQDVRTVIVLRRQLAMELPRLRPWVALRPRVSSHPVFSRGVRGVLRWPAARVARAVLLAIVIGAALRGAWAGTVPLVVVAGIGLFLAGLDAVESLAQDVDHPTRRDSVPIEQGAIHVRHVPVAAAVGVAVGALAAIVAALPGPGRVPADVAALLAVPAGLGAVGGALVSLLSGGATVVQGDTWNLMPPEVAGMRLVARSTWPPAIAIIGALPVVAARAAAHHDSPARAGATAAAVGVILLFAVIVGWVRTREQIHEWFRTQMQQAMPARSEERANA